MSANRSKLESMLRFNATNLEELQEEVNQRAHEVSVAVVTAICDALDAGVDRVEVGLVKGGGISLGVEQKDFLRSMQTNLDRCQEVEEYELCARAVEWMAKLQ